VGRHFCEIVITTRRAPESGIRIRSRAKPSFLLVRTVGSRLYVPCWKEEDTALIYIPARASSSTLQSYELQAYGKHSPNSGVTETLSSTCSVVLPCRKPILRTARRTDETLFECTNHVLGSRVTEKGQPSNVRVRVPATCDHDGQLFSS
jgi:hypothetical protein